LTLTLVWIAFIVFVLVMLALDLFVLNRNPHVIKTREALGWTGVCVLLGLAFNGAVFYLYENDVGGIGTRYHHFYSREAKDRQREGSGHAGEHDDHSTTSQSTLEAPAAIITPDAAAAGGTIPATDTGVGTVRVLPPADSTNPIPLAIPTGMGWPAAVEFFTGWLIEYSLSLDNIFVIALIFTHFKVPSRNQHRVLFWGILGALVFRGVMIGAGTALVNSLEWILYVFGALLIVTAIKLLRQQEDHFEPEKGIVYRLARRFLPFSDKLDGDRFFTRIDGRLLATPLFLVLLVVETTDVVFAIDSIPAILSITKDPFLVFTSNVFAILGLRSLYFALAALMDKFGYLKFSLAFILAFVGFKMIVEGFGVHVSQEVSLGVIGTALAVGIGTSLVLAPKTAKEEHESDHAVGTAAHDAGTSSPSGNDGGNKAKNH
jgi:tellurite resistance protein TerC